MMSKVDDTTVGVHVQLVLLVKWEAETAATSANSEPNKQKIQNANTDIQVLVRHQWTWYESSVTVHVRLDSLVYNQYYLYQ